MESADQSLGRMSCVAWTAALPFAPHLVQAIRAKLELIAKSAQHGRFIAVRSVLKRAGNVVGPFPLLAVVDEMILLQHRADPVQGLRINAGPEQREVADVPVDFAAGMVFGWQRWATGTWSSPAVTHAIANLLQMG